jgi:tetratricopeptide (TPR) repeat protein
MMSRFILLIVLMTGSMTSGLLAYADNPPTTPNLRDTAQKLFADFYAQSNLLHKNYLQKNVNKLATIEQLVTQVTQELKAARRFSAIQLVTGNLGLIRTNIEANDVIHIFDLLLEMEALEQAKALLLIATQTASDNVISKMHYRLALFYYAHEDWKKTLKEIDAITARNALTQDESDYAYVIYGVVLQNLKQHRQAITYYDQVGNTSNYYGYAQLNKAIAFLRQGWWTDADLTIETAVSAESVTKNPELLNRLFLFIGYAQIHHEFYRNARDSFRKISVKSEYADKALLGIGLCAIHQGDFAGGLNAFNLLKRKDSDDIAVIESRLLSAYTYVLLGKKDVAAEQYTNAIIYYQNKLNEIVASKQSSLQNIPLNSEYLPSWLKVHIESLQEFKQLALSNSERAKISSLYDQYLSLTKTLLNKGYDERIEVLSSYLAQSQLGQAQLYDKDK